MRINHNYEQILPFYQGKAWVKEFGAPWTIIDEEGREVSKKLFDFDRVYPFSEGRALVPCDGRFALVDVEGAVFLLVDPVFQEAELSESDGFRNGLAELRLRTPNARVQVYVDRSGRVVWRSDQPGTAFPDDHAEEK